VSDDLAAWLREQIGARLALARAANCGPWREDGMAIRGSAPEYAASIGEPLVVKHTWPQESGHIVANDPRDTIARCDAEIAVLDELEGARAALRLECDDYGAWVRGETSGPRPAIPGPSPMLIPGLERAVALIASGYRHRPGYREEWKP
jgi:hypothetical protein